jgi:hypothetical protein
MTAVPFSSALTPAPFWGLQPELRPLTRDELRAVLSGGGYPGARWGLPTPEDNPEMHPYRARGCYPDPGIYERMDRRDPNYAAGATKIEYYVPSLDWSPRPPVAPTAQESEHAETIAADLDDQPGGLGFAIRMMTTCVQFGFALLEEVWREKDDGTLTIGELVWLRPATIQAWIVDEACEWRYIVQQSERGMAVIPRGKLLHVTWRGRSRAPEGNAASRPLAYYNEYKRQLMQGDAITRQRYGVGTLVWQQPDDGGTEQEIADVELMSQRWEAGEQSYFIPPPRWSYKIEYGGSQAPDPRNRLDYLDHETARVFDDCLGELGMSRYGSHAVGSEMRLSKQRQLTGVCREWARAIDQQVIDRIYRANGWAGRHARMMVTGFEDAERLSSIKDLADSQLIDVTPAVKASLARSVGLQP